MPRQEALGSMVVMNLAVDLHELAESAIANQRLICTQKALSFDVVERRLVLPIVDDREPVNWNLDNPPDLRIGHPQHFREGHHPLHRWPDHPRAVNQCHCCFSRRSFSFHGFSLPISELTGLVGSTGRSMALAHRRRRTASTNREAPPSRRAAFALERWLLLHR